MFDTWRDRRSPGKTDDCWCLAHQKWDFVSCLFDVLMRMRGFTFYIPVSESNLHAWRDLARLVCLSMCSAKIDAGLDMFPGELRSWCLNLDFYLSKFYLSNFYLSNGQNITLRQIQIKCAVGKIELLFDCNSIDTPVCCEDILFWVGVSLLWYL